MPFEARKFIFTVSLCAMLAVNPVLADKVENLADLGTPHDVYVESTIDGMAESGIAGVKYVNRMVNVAGAAAQKAEDHAASAGGSANDAATSAANAQTAADKAADDAAAAAASAKAANDALDNKLNKSLGAGNENKAMVTDADGTVYPGYVSADMIKGDPFYTGYLEGAALVTRDGRASWGQVGSAGIADRTVTTDKIASPGVGGVALVSFSGNDGAGVEWGKIGSEGIAGKKYTLLEYSGIVLRSAPDGTVSWGQIGSGDIADGAVTAGKIAVGVVTANNIANEAVSTEKISGLAVTWDKIADHAVTADKMDSSGRAAGVALVADGIGGAKWGQVGSVGIAPGAVKVNHIADEAVTSNKLALAGVTGCYSGGWTYGSQEYCGALGLTKNGDLETMTIEKLIDFDRIDGFDRNKDSQFLVAQREPYNSSGHVLRAVPLDFSFFGVSQSAACGPGTSKECVLTMRTDGSVSWQPK